ncbi:MULTISPECIES: secondary thiamine-phosphate synthase enzyme YjbQ [unclassified Corallococcus]|uniref:secondary thiamine-phosphate synthase enzyme YjbQ n=1 Tax=unclassified Corallococcus TaxID=2685029 RepID=UPI001A8FEA69|nr:secondary thiamine-phosphate synthase enzyme YjbQ [Corallococcus sp. NCRR]MBN9688078.1 YjbQ family protein [Corallococcus sp. NCSPR001]WAS88112.1 secondary thiamine-phosphate synthase enzyme YjbQ [Corallococcus sp. NCRR]
MYQAKELTVSTRGRGLVDITGEVQRAVKGTGIREGLCTVFLHHTSASLIIGENADPVVQRDLEAFFSRLVKDGDPLFQHDAEGPDDMPAHVRTVLTQLSLSIPVKDGQADLGTWQGVYVWEHRTSPHRRRVTVSVLGD